MYELDLLEAELKKRTDFPYIWKRINSPALDKETDFIYDFISFDAVVEKIRWTFRRNQNKDDYFNYALNRWYNYHTAIAIENIFCSIPAINSFKNKRGRLKYFKIDDVSFTQKSAVFPSSYPKTILESKKSKENLIKWLYGNDKKGLDRHHKIFILFYDNHGHHWKLRAELSWIKRIVETYLGSFDINQLISIKYNDKLILNDVIFAEK